MKKCSSCKIKKSLKYFYKDKNTKSGYSYVCKECDKKRSKKRKKGPFEVFCKICEKKFISRISNGCFCSAECKNVYDVERLKKFSKTKKGIEAKKKYSKSDKRRNYIREYNFNKRRIDINFKINENISNAIRKCLNDSQTNKNKKHWENIIEQNLLDILNYLENQFDENMSWNNYGIYWQIDHIIPVSSYNFNLPFEIKKCWNKNNLRPLEKYQNNSKSNYLDVQLIKEYKIENLLPYGINI